MAEEKGGAERTEEPTPRRRQQDFEKGDPAVSQEANIAASLMVLLMATAWVMPTITPGLVDTFRRALDFGDFFDSATMQFELGRDGVVSVLRNAARRVAALVVPVGLASMLTLVAVNVAQVGPRFQVERLGFKWSKLDPRSGIKRVFSPQFFVTLLKSLAKGIGIVAIATYALRQEPGQLWGLPFAVTARVPSYLRQIAITVLFPVTFAVIVIAMLDFAWTRYRKEQGLKMSKQEVREDMKSDTGDPQIRQARRQRMRDLVLGAPLPEKMKDATVVATNPTHYAVALRYWAGKDEAPVVVAKGKDFRAARIRALATELEIPIVEDKPLARGLFGLVKEGGAIPRELFQAVARLLAIVYRMREGETR